MTLEDFCWKAQQAAQQLPAPGPELENRIEHIDNFCFECIHKLKPGYHDSSSRRVTLVWCWVLKPYGFEVCVMSRPGDEHPRSVELERYAFGINYHIKE